MNTPRLRQLRRDKALFTLAMNTVRLHLEEADRLTQQPQLREAPDDDMRLIQQHIDYWVGLATNYLMQKFRCPAGQAMDLLGELLADLKRSVSVHELRQVPFTRALAMSSSPVASQPPADAEQPTENAPLNEQAQLAKRG
jgi:hypothetical protein